MDSACGVWASSEVDGKRFYVACLKISAAGEHGSDAKKEIENFQKAWISLGKPPIIAVVAGNVTGELSLEKDATGFHSVEWTATETAESDGIHTLYFSGRNQSHADETTDKH